MEISAQGIAKNFLFLFIGEICSKLFTFLAIIYLARILGVEGFGKIGFAQIVISYFFLFATLGLDVFGTREIARNREESKNYAQNIVGMRLCLSVLSYLLLILFVLFLPNHADTKNLIFYYGLTIFVNAFLLEWIFMGIEKMQWVALERLIVQGLNLLLLVLLVKGSGDLLKVPFLQIVAMLVGFSLLWIYFSSIYGKIKIKFTFQKWGPILRQSLPIGISFIMTSIYYGFPILALGLLRNARSVGLYNASFKICAIIIAFQTIYANALFPVVSRLFKQSREDLKKLLTGSTKLTIILGLPLGMGGTILAPRIIHFFYGPLYAESTFILQVLIWSTVAIIIGCNFGNSLLACKEEKKYMISVGIGAICAVIANILLIPFFDFKGASIANLVSHVIVFACMVYYFSRIIKIEIGKYLPVCILATLSMGIVVHFSQVALYFSLPLAIILYFLLLFLLRGLRWNEVRFYRKILSPGVFLR